jgi:2-oxoglutarate dehydrogenase E2 component (dihydrolipoamide succinyltransferase)
VEQSFWQNRLDTGDARATAAALDELAAKLVRKLRVDQASGGVRAAETVQVSTRKAPADDGAPRRGLTSNLAEGPAAAPPSASPRRESKSARATFALPRLDESNAAAVAAKLRRAAEPLLAQLHAKPASLVILSLGVAFKAEIAGARGSGDIGAFCRKPAAGAAAPAAPAPAPAPPAPPPEERYAAPSGADVDASVLAELPKDLREAVEAQMRLDAAVSRKSPPAKRAAVAPRASPPPKRPKSTMAAFLAKPPRPPAAPRPPDGGLDRILEMGFGRARAEAALAAAGGDAARAIETLLAS